MPSQVWICVATYQRALQLGYLLDSLLPEVMARPGTHVVVVDNDRERSAAGIVSDHPLATTYVHEPTPGIAAARNRALDAVPKSAQWVVFVDDDERVTPGWLDGLVTSAEVNNADVVSGPAIVVYPPGTPRWIAKGKFVWEGNYPNGPLPHPPSTCNVLVRADVFSGPNGVRFSEAFSMTGGSDTELFSRLRDMGMSFFWCQEAAVYADAPVSRVSVRWICRRGMRYGNVLARIQLKSRSRPRVLLGGLARIVYGLVRVTGALITGRGLRYVDCIYILRGAGFIEVVFGEPYKEYARAD